MGHERDYIQKALIKNELKRFKFLKKTKEVLVTR